LGINMTSIDDVIPQFMAIGKIIDDHQWNLGFINVQSISNPYAPCMEYVPTFAQKTFKCIGKYTIYGAHGKWSFNRHRAL
jgi:hypothetical protein